MYGPTGFIAPGAGYRREVSAPPATAPSPTASDEPTAPGPHGHQQAVLAAFAANLGIAVAKLAGFLVTGSSSMAAEAVHSFADTGNQGLLVLGERRSRRPPSRLHPFGNGAEGYFWSFVVAMVLFAGGGLFALFEAEEKLRHPHALESTGWAVGILLVAIVLEAASLRTAMRSGRAEKGGRSWPAFVRQSKRAELPVVLLEDTGALVGLGFALAGVILAAATGNPRFDAIGSLAIGVLLVGIALALAGEMKSLLIGEAASPELTQKLTGIIEGDPRVIGVVELRTMHLGPEQILVAGHIRLDPRIGAGDDVGDTLADLTASVRRAVPEAQAVYLVPAPGSGDARPDPIQTAAGTN
jgi:cation diffusion facilitator family transporter